MYKKEYEQVFKTKDEDWKKKHDYKNLKDFSFQADKVGVEEKEDKDKIDQKLPAWVKTTKSRFYEMKDMINRANENKLMTRLGKKSITLKDAEELLEDIISGKNNKKKARAIYDSIADDTNKLVDPKSTVSREKIFIFKQLQEIFMGSKADDEEDNEIDNEVDDEVDDETDEQPDTTDMPELESDESAAQRTEHEGKALKILTPKQTLSRLSISLAQLKAGNNLQKLKNEIRQLLYPLYR